MVRGLPPFACVLVRSPSIGRTHIGCICNYIPDVLLYCGPVNFGAVLPLSVLSYLNERWKDKSTSSILAAGCPPRLKLYPPAFAADLSSTMRLRSISSPPIGSISSIRSASTVTARLRAHTVPIGLGADSKSRLELGWVTCGPELLLRVVASSLL